MIKGAKCYKIEDIASEILAEHDQYDKLTHYF